MITQRFEKKGTDITCYLEECYLAISSRATAHLYKGDRYNEKTGKKIAYYKALEKLLQKLSSCYRQSAIDLTKSEARCWREHSRRLNEYLKLKHKFEEGKIWHI